MKKSFLCFSFSLLLSRLIFAQAGMTADELLVFANAQYSKENFSVAADAYRQFVSDYGNAAEARLVMARIRYPLAWSLIHARRFSEAREAVEECLRQIPTLPPQEMEEMRFWKGVCAYHAEDWDVARAALEEFAHAYPRSQKSSEALLLAGQILLGQKKFSEAADYFFGIRDRVGKAYRGRVLVREMSAHLQSDTYDEALALVREVAKEEEPLSEGITFQLQVLDLADKCLQAERPRDALLCLQKIQTAEALRSDQKNRLASVQQALSASERLPQQNPFRRYLLMREQADIQMQMAQLEKIANFDAIRYVRLAHVYQTMGRFREAAIVLEELLRSGMNGAEVESYTAAAVQYRIQCNHWLAAIENARLFTTHFPKSVELPRVLYLRGIAEQKMNRFDKACQTFDLLMRGYAENDFAIRAGFMKGFTELLDDRPDEAVQSMETFLRKHAKHPLADAALYWRGMAYSFAKNYDRCREVMEDYLQRFPEGNFVASAIFRKAYAAHAKRDFSTSIGEMKAFLKDFSDTSEAVEAMILLGDAYMNEGEMEQGMAILGEISKEQGRFYEEAVFKIAKALRLLDQPEEMVMHLEKFCDASPQSPRVGEALFLIGKEYRQNGQLEKARDLYWDAIRSLGDVPENPFVEDLLFALAKLYPSPEEKSAYENALEQLEDRARIQKQNVLLRRMLWARAGIYKKSDPVHARSFLLQIAHTCDPQTTHPLLMADCAEALMEEGQVEKARELFRELLRWNPRAPQKDRALFALGRIHLQEGDLVQAATWFKRLLAEVPESSLIGKTLLEKANLEAAQNRSEDEMATLETLLATKFVSGATKAEALYRLGEYWKNQGKLDKAFAYYQRIYVLYGRWSQWVAKAYLRSGEILEARQDTEGAKKTYEEMTSREELAEFIETEEAVKRLTLLRS